MGDAELMTIGRFARLTGLSIHALRHYDDVSLLIPAHTDPQTGYRHYGHDQIRLAHLIRELRWIDLLIEEIRQVLAEAGQAGSVLAGHRQQLLRRRGLLTAQIDNVDRLLEEGFTMSAALSGCLPVQITIAVDDLAASIAFYQAAFDLRYEVTRRTDDTDHSSFMFGEYGRDGFFLLHLSADIVDTDRPGPTTFGLLVDDLDPGTRGPWLPEPPRSSRRETGRACLAVRPSKIPTATGSGSTRADQPNARSCRRACTPIPDETEPMSLGSTERESRSEQLRPTTDQSLIINRSVDVAGELELPPSGS